MKSLSRINQCFAMPDFKNLLSVPVAGRLDTCPYRETLGYGGDLMEQIHHMFSISGGGRRAV
ncbi:hypothetical protein Plhal304r1_c008g0033011 [Plasmopara halstedii]